MHGPLIIHEQNREYAYPLDKNTLCVRLRAQAEALDSCSLIYEMSLEKEIGKQSRIEMDCYARDSAFDYFECVIKSQETVCYLKYFFEAHAASVVFYADYLGSHPDKPTDSSHLFHFQCANEGDAFVTPDWVEDAVFYQIFPERFFNGDPANDPDGAEPWGSAPSRTNFMGGDLKGITEKVGYLTDLGVTAIYLNPIFVSPSNHKYDTADYLAIDASFGTQDDLKELVRRCHSYGIRVVLDGVFNHCGYEFMPFQDVISHGEQSPYADWFYINGYPVDKERLNYECFGHYGLMPKMKLSNPEVRQFILGVARRWMEAAEIDGWRLDVADEVDHTFWVEFRRMVKQINPQCFLIAETWKENTDLLSGDQFDSLMNYLFRSAVVDFFGKAAITSVEFNARINRFVGVYKDVAVKALYNLIGSHDTPRFLTVCGGDIRKMKAAVAFQLCFIGVPAVFYGDEAGMTGENDPDCRKCMQLEGQNEELLAFHKQLILIRKGDTALRKGRFTCNYCSPADGVYGFQRSWSGGTTYVAINNSESPCRVTIPVMEGPEASMEDRLSGRQFAIQKPKYAGEFFLQQIVNVFNGSVELELEAYGISIFSKAAPDDEPRRVC